MNHFIPFIQVNSCTGELQSQQFIITTEIDTTEAREALALPKIAALRRLCGVYLCGGSTLQAS
ncbi:MAG TPA: hypothetical protein VLE95_08460 [Chlamydiales bacterium]|nr:hypothetical protein [Chlamydiales bacterium]